MKDEMLTVLYEKCFQARDRAEILGHDGASHRKRGVALAENRLLSELIDIRTEQIRRNKS